jgi:uncharacterized protein
MTTTFKKHLVFMLASLVLGCSATPKPSPSPSAPSESSPKPTASTTSKNPMISAALLVAASKGDLDAVKETLAKGAEVNATDQDQRTALMLASFDGHTEVAAYLIEQGAQVDALDPNGRTPLMFASSGPFPETVELLLKGGAYVDTADSVEGWTALMFAAGEGHVEVCQALLENKADPNLKDKDGDTALDHARANQHQNVLELLNK